MRLFFALICLTSLYVQAEEKERVVSSPQQIASITCSPEFLLQDFVSPFGLFGHLHATDLVAKGAQGIVMDRRYTHPYLPASFAGGPFARGSRKQWDLLQLGNHMAQHGRGWQFLDYTRLHFKMAYREALFCNKQGVTLAFRIDAPRGEQLIGDTSGLSNWSGGQPHGSCDMRNTYLMAQGEDHIVVHTPCGEALHYVEAGWVTQETKLFLLQKEILANGKQLCYRYDEKNQLKRIESTDPKGRFVWAWVDVQGSPESGKCHLSSSSNDSVDYIYDIKKIRVNIDGSEAGNRCKVTADLKLPQMVRSCSSLNGTQKYKYSEKMLLEEFPGKAGIVKCGYEPSLGYAPQALYQTRTLSQKEEDKLPLIYFAEGDNKTVAHFATGESIVYHFSDALLPLAVEYRANGGQLVHCRTWRWTDNQWLQEQELLDGEQRLIYRKHFDYDRWGNPVQETITGDLSGSGQLQSYTIRRRYSDEGNHLLLEEEHENGKLLFFDYLPGTNLLVARLTATRLKETGDSIVQREFFVYDDCHNIVQTMVDDGSAREASDLFDVTMRKITSYRRRQSAPFLHMIEAIEEKYIEDGIEKGVCCTEYVYDAWGNVCKERCLDAHQQEIYSICRQYDRAGRVISESNTLGGQAKYAWDERGNCIEEHPCSGRLKIERRYDGRNLLIEERRIGDDCPEEKTPFSWERNRWDLGYRCLSNSPGTCGDVLQRKLTETDGGGHTTHYRYNAYGDPTEICYADGARVQYRYEKAGFLLAEKRADGSEVVYKRDSFGRILQKNSLDPQGLPLAQELFCYKGFKLTQTSDREGLKTIYRYNGLGQVIEKQRGERQTYYAYDDLGRLNKITYDGREPLVVHYVHDLLGHIVEVSQRNITGQILSLVRYGYDAEGNCTRIEREVQGKPAVDGYRYDAYGRLIEHVDALGNSSKVIWGKEKSGSKQLLTCESIDPNGISTLECFDCDVNDRRRLVRREVRKAGQGIAPVLYSSTLFSYDACGCLVDQIEHVYEAGQYVGDYRRHYSWDGQHRCVKLEEGWGNALRTTITTYYPNGSVASKTGPEGHCIFYTYDGLGYLSGLRSSDGTVNYGFIHNRQGHLLEAHDLISGQTLKRSVDGYGNLCREELASNAVIERQFDERDRLTHLSSPGKAEVDYLYNALYLCAVERKDATGKLLYRHSFDQYDSAGNLLKETPFSSDPIYYEYDALCRPVSHKGPHLQECCSYDLNGNIQSSVCDGCCHIYHFDPLSNLQEEKSPYHTASYLYNSLGARVGINGVHAKQNTQGEVVGLSDIQCVYNAAGQEILKKTPVSALRLVYDALGRLKEATNEWHRVQYEYDPLSRLIGRKLFEISPAGWRLLDKESYLWADRAECGALNEEGQIKNWRILAPLAKGKIRPVAIEIKGHAYIPVVNLQGNICKLFDPGSKQCTHNYRYDGSGRIMECTETVFNPWRFLSERFDPELHLVGTYPFFDPQLDRYL